MSDIDEGSDFEDIEKRGKRRKMSDIDEGSDFEDIEKRGKRREMSDIDEGSDFEDIEKRRKKSSSYQKIGVKNIGNENDDEIMQERVLPKRKPPEFLSTNDVLNVLRNPKDMILPNIPNGIKENIRYIVCNKDNVSKRNGGIRSVLRTKLTI